MTAAEFVALVHEAFTAQGWTSSHLEDGVLSTVHLDVWTKQVSERCTTARAEGVVCRLVRDRGLDPTRVRFGPVFNGHLLVQYRADLRVTESLAGRSTWKRLTATGR